MAQNDDMRWRYWAIFPKEWDNEHDTDVDALDSAQESANINSADSASLGEGGESANAGESAGVSGEASAGAGEGAGAGVGAGAGAGAGAGVGM